MIKNVSRLKPAVVGLYNAIIIISLVWLGLQMLPVIANAWRLATFALKSQLAVPTEAAGSHILSLSNESPYNGALLINVPGPSPRAPLLYLVTTQNCPTCEAAVDVWMRASRRAARMPTVWLVSDSPSQVNAPGVQQTEGTQLRIHETLIEDPNRFILYTGISVAPLALAFRTTDSYVCAIAGVPPDAQADECIRSMTRPRATNKLVLARHGTVTPINPRLPVATTVTPPE